MLLIHGDSHTMRADYPLKKFANFIGLETYGSPDIGWVRVVVDTLTGQITAYDPRRMRGMVARPMASSSKP